jgi:hypothetical protein
MIKLITLEKGLNKKEIMFYRLPIAAMQMLDSFGSAANRNFLPA